MSYDIPKGTDRYEKAKELRLLARDLLTQQPLPQTRLQLEMFRSKASKPGKRMTITEVRERLETLQVSFDKETLRQREIHKKLHGLAQHMATAPDLPNGAAENKLRAIMAILRKDLETTGESYE